MAGKFSVGDIRKITRHKSDNSILENYDPGLRITAMADMSMAIAQASKLKRGHDFESISEHLVKKRSNARIEHLHPSKMVQNLGNHSTTSPSAEGSTSFTSFAEPAADDFEEVDLPDLSDDVSENTVL